MKKVESQSGEKVTKGGNWQILRATIRYGIRFGVDPWKLT